MRCNILYAHHYYVMYFCNLYVVYVNKADMYTNEMCLCFAVMKFHYLNNANVTPVLAIAVVSLDH